MEFNSDKFEVVRYWPKGNAANFQYLAPDKTPIQEKFKLRDLGIELSADLNFKSHIENIIAGANKITGMLLRTFRRRSKYVMISLWETIVQPKLDYCSQLWSPTDQGSIAKLELMLRNFTSKIDGCQELDFWQRLKVLILYS